MNKEEFLHELAEKIKKYSKNDTEGSISYYSEMIDDRIEDGMTEEEAVASLGSINTIVKQIEEEYADINGGHRRPRGPLIASIIFALAVLLIGGYTVYSVLDDDEPQDQNIQIITSSSNNPDTIVEITTGDEIAKMEKTFSLTGKNGIKEITSNLTAYKITYEASDESDIRVVYQDRLSNPLYSVTSKDGILSLGVEGNTSENKIHGLSQSDLSLIRNKKIAFTIYVPKKYVGTYTLHNSSCDIELNNLNIAKGLQVNCTSGDMYLTKLSGNGTIEANLVSGDALFKDITLQGDLKVDCTSGDLTGNNLNISNAIDIDMTSGSVSLGLSDAMDNYTITTKVISGSNNLPTHSGNGSKRLNANVVSGDLDVTFGK